ncbi:hypothetical protein L204_104633 [Cryptococcus depauperatus]
MLNINNHLHTSRYDSDVPKILSRNSACHACRRRKLKCDANRPVCSNCQKYRAKGLGSSEMTEECKWDEIKEPSARTKRRREQAKRQAMEGEDLLTTRDEDSKAKRTKPDELEGRIAASEGVTESWRQSTSTSSNQTGCTNPYTIQTQPSGQFDFPHIYKPTSLSLGGYTGDKVYDSNDDCGTRVEIFRDEHAPVNNEASISDHERFDKRLAGSGVEYSQNKEGRYVNSESKTLLEEQSEIIWPDWPRDLPTPAAVDHAVKVFFEKVPTLPKMLNKTMLTQSLQRPPSSQHFPCTSLIHAILAITANFIPESSLRSKAYFPVGSTANTLVHPERNFDTDSSLETGTNASQYFISSTFRSSPSPMARFQLWHRRKAFETFYHYVDRGDKFLQCLQAQVIATTVDQYNAWWTDLWIESGMCVRIATPMRINDSPNMPESSLRRQSGCLLPPAQSALEQAERDRSWWMIFILERSVTASTTWPTSLVDDEITVELPCLQSVYDQGYGDLAGSQSLQSPDLLSFHPPEHRDSLCFYIKALKILGDVNVFFRRYSRGRHSISEYISNPTFRILLSQVNTFRMSFPPEFRGRSTQKAMGDRGANIDRDLIIALWITHSAIMSLGEPLITKDTWMEEGARVTLSAIRATLSLLYDVTSTSYDLSLFPPHCTFVWCLSCRGLTRFVSTAIQCGDLVSASVFHSEIEVFRMALKRYGERFPTGIRHLKVVDDLLDQISRPINGLNHSIYYDCTKDHVIKYGRHVGSSVTTASTSSSLIVTPNQDQMSNEPDTSRSSLFTSLSHNPLHDFAHLTSNVATSSLNSNLSSNLAAGEFHTDSPAFLSPPVANGWDITSFSFDVSSMVAVFEGGNASFEGGEYGLSLAV